MDQLLTLPSALCAVWPRRGLLWVRVGRALRFEAADVVRFVTARKDDLLARWA